ncbi:Ubiquitin C-terminal hydrolase 13 [Linum grandiflorum]
MAAMKKDTQIFTWRIQHFSKLKPVRLDSDTFLAGGYEWRVQVYPKGHYAVDYLSVYLETMCSGVTADFSFTLVGQLTGSSSVKMSSRQTFNKGNPTSWGFRRFVPIGDLDLVNDTLIIEAEVSTDKKPSSEVASTDEPKVIETDQASKAIKVDSVQSISRNLIAELSTMTAACPNYSIPGDGSGVLQQQREKLLGFLDKSLDALSQSKSLDEVENIALGIFKQTANPLEKTVLNDLVSRLAEFKQIVPISLSTIEASHDVESSVAQMIKGLEVRLVHRKGQLTSLEAEIGRLEEEGIKLEAEFQQLSARKERTCDHRNSTAVELEKANEEASKELEELKKQQGRRTEAVGKRMDAKDKLAQANASWKLFKEKLGWQQNH